MVGIYEDLNALEHILEGRQKPNNLSYSLLQFMTKNFSIERKMGNNEFGEFFKVILTSIAFSLTFLTTKLNFILRAKAHGHANKSS